jgi:hypothetical protein
MPSTRRGFLAGVTALAGGLAGCNDRTGRAVDRTVTPVEVPRTEREVLRKVTAIEAPSIPPAPVVSEAHLESAIDQLDRLKRSLADVVESREKPVGDAPRFGPEGTPEATVEQVDERIRQARETEPSAEALDALGTTLHDVAMWIGYLRADSGDLSLADVEDALEVERAAVRAVRDDLEYRVAVPVADNLPAMHAAEQRFQRLGDDDRMEVQPAEGDAVERNATAASEPEPTPTPEPEPTPTPEPDAEHVAHRYYRLERVRRQRDDVERYLETATDDGAPSVRAPLQRELTDVRKALEPIAAEYRTDEGQSRGESLVESIKGLRRSFGGGPHRYLSRTPAEPPDGELVRVLFDGVEQLVSFRATDAGVERTLERLEGRRFPTETLIGEKQRAAERLEHAAEQSALHRAFAGRAEQVLRSADEFEHREDANVEQVARMHALYVASGEWADRAVDRADAISSAIQAQQS